MDQKYVGIGAGLGHYRGLVDGWFRLRRGHRRDDRPDPGCRLERRMITFVCANLWQIRERS